VALSHTSLENYYSMIFALAQHHKYSITEIESLIPYERDIYVDMLMAHLEEQKKEIESRRK
jgi:hypothetical protein